MYMYCTCYVHVHLHVHMHSTCTCYVYVMYNPPPPPFFDLPARRPLGVCKSGYLTPVRRTLALNGPWIWVSGLLEWGWTLVVQQSLYSRTDWCGGWVRRVIPWKSASLSPNQHRDALECSCSENRPWKILNIITYPLKLRTCKYGSTISETNLNMYLKYELFMIKMLYH